MSRNYRVLSGPTQGPAGGRIAAEVLTACRLQFRVRNTFACGGITFMTRPHPGQREGAAHFHGPENAEYEIRKAYNAAIEESLTYHWDRKPIPGVNPDEVIELYRHAFNCHRNGARLAAERWARSAKHLARAFWHE